MCVYYSEMEGVPGSQLSCSVNFFSETGLTLPKFLSGLISPFGDNGWLICYCTLARGLAIPRVIRYERRTIHSSYAPCHMIHSPLYQMSADHGDQQGSS